MLLALTLSAAVVVTVLLFVFTWLTLTSVAATCFSSTRVFLSLIPRERSRKRDSRAPDEEPLQGADLTQVPDGLMSRSPLKEAHQGLLSIQV